MTPAPYAQFAAKTTPLKNVVTVAQSGGQFTTITAALNSITDNSATNKYVVRVAPGTYSETVTMKQFVDIEGSGELTTKITFIGSASNTTGTVVGANNAELRSLTVENTGGNTQAIAIFNISASPSLLHVTVTASGASTANHGVYNINSSSPNMTNVTATASGGSGTFNFGVYNDASSPKIVTSIISASGGSPNYGIYSTTSGTVTIDSSKITASTRTIFNGSGVTTQVGASQLSGGAVFNGGTLSCSASYALSGTTNEPLNAKCVTKQMIDNVVTVGQLGADFTTITAALNFITDATATNKYLIKVAPGTYSERVTMKQFVDIEGSGELTTKITFTGSNSLTGTVVGASNAELRFLTVENTGGNSYAIAIYNSSASPSLLHVIANASGGSPDNYGVANFSSSSPSMTNVTATASSASTNFGVYNNTSSPSMTNVTATASGGSGSNNIGVYNLNFSSPSMTNVTATASGGTNSYGVFNSSSSPKIVTNIISASGGTNNYGVYGQASGTVTIDNSKITGSTRTILNGSGVTTQVGASQLSGGPVTNSGTLTCAGVYDENYAFFAGPACP